VEISKEEPTKLSKADHRKVNTVEIPEEEPTNESKLCTTHKRNQAMHHTT